MRAGEIAQAEMALRAEYSALQEELGWTGLDLPDLDWLVGEEEAEEQADDSA